MASVAVVPFPADSSPAAQFAAMKYLLEASAGPLKSTITAIGDFDATWIGLAKTAAERVQREAPGAPDHVKAEACVRYFGYLTYSTSSGGGGYGAIRSSTIGPSTEQFVVNHQRAWINCGAKSMLAPWKPLRVAVIRNEVEA